MNQKEPYQAEGERIPEYLHEVTVNGRKLMKGMHATLTAPQGRKEKRRYEFRFGELLGGVLVLTFYGPVAGRVQRMRTVREPDVLVVHSKSEAR